MADAWKITEGGKKENSEERHAIKVIKPKKGKIEVRTGDKVHFLSI